MTKAEAKELEIDDEVVTEDGQVARVIAYTGVVIRYADGLTIKHEFDAYGWEFLERIER